VAWDLGVGTAGEGPRPNSMPSWSLHNYSRLLIDPTSAACRRRTRSSTTSEHHSPFARQPGTSFVCRAAATDRAKLFEPYTAAIADWSSNSVSSEGRPRRAVALHSFHAGGRRPCVAPWPVGAACTARDGRLAGPFLRRGACGAKDGHPSGGEPGPMRLATHDNGVEHA